MYEFKCVNHTNTAIYLIKTDSLGNTNCSSDIVTQSDSAIPMPYLVVSPTETSISNLLVSHPSISIILHHFFKLVTYPPMVLLLIFSIFWQ